RQVVARRAPEAAGGEGTGLRSEGGKRNQSRLRKPAWPVRPADARLRTREKLWNPAAPADRYHLALGGQTARGVQRWHHKIQGRALTAVAVEGDLRRENRTWRREQPGRVEPCWQG